MIALDAMGGDRAPAETVRGALLACNELGLQVALVGDEARLRHELSALGETPSGITIVPASEAIGMDEAPVQAVRQKKDASINVMMGLVKDGTASAAVSAGSTGAAMASALLHLGRIPGIERPAIGAIAPYSEAGVLVLDIGANVECKASYLVQFGQMGSFYMEKARGVRKPRVALLNIGEEANKGTDLMLETYERLQASGLNFVGNVEPDRLHQNIADVVVTDGFTGNVAVKLVEGVADFLFSQLRTSLTSKLHYKLAALVLKPALLATRSRLDYGEYGGAPMLGVDGIVTIAHGRADATAIRSALRATQETVASGMLEGLRATFAEDRTARRAVEQAAR
jgi:glycerol-3-phosphate acyltransferase PlsX